MSNVREPFFLNGQVIGYFLYQEEVERILNNLQPNMEAKFDVLERML